ITVLPAATERLLVVTDGQTPVPGDKPDSLAGTGRINTPTPTDAGDSIGASIRAVDKYWNITPSSNPTVSVVTSDNYDTDPGATALSFGSAAVTAIMTTAGNQTITASGAGVSNVSSLITI